MFDSGIDDLVAVLVEESPQALGASLDQFDQKDWAAPFDCLQRALERLQFHTSDVKFNEIDTRQRKRID